MNDKITNLKERRQKTKPQSKKEVIKDAIKYARQHIRNVGAENLEEPEAFASGGDMNEFAKDPDTYDKKERKREKNDERNKK